MARVAGVEIPNDKRVVIALTYIYGLGLSSSRSILAKAGINENIRVKALEDSQMNAIKKVIDEECQIEGDLRTRTQLNLKRLMDISSYRGIRHRLGLPSRGQRTRTNSRTRKGKRKTIAGKKKAPSKG